MDHGPVRKHMSKIGKMVELAIGLSTFLIVLAAVADGVTNGRVAQKGEFPSVVRISFLSGSRESTRVATGVLITVKQVLTTCDSVGFLNINKVKRFKLSMVTIHGGSVWKDAGVKKSPTDSKVHPRCHFLASGIVLFNLGIYEFDVPFTDGLDGKLLRPVGNLFKSGQEMRKSLKYLWTEFEMRKAPPSGVHCNSAGWGHPVRIYEGRGEPDDSQAISSALQVANMTVVDYDYCTSMTCEFFDECFISIWEYGLVCAQAIAGGPCRNDRGAPLFCNEQIYAIHTHPQPCLEKSIPRHFVRIDLAYDFVFGDSKSRRSRQPADLMVTAAALTTFFTCTSW